MLEKILELLAALALAITGGAGAADVAPGANPQAAEAVTTTAEARVTLAKETAELIDFNMANAAERAASEHAAAVLEWTTCIATSAVTNNPAAADLVPGAEDPGFDPKDGCEPPALPAEAHGGEAGEAVGPPFPVPVEPPIELPVVTDGDPDEAGPPSWVPGPPAGAGRP
jgi:hypothetical protein